MKSPKQALVLLTFRPDLQQVEFYESFVSHGYSVLVIVDDSDYVVPVSSLARYIKVNDQACVSRGYLLLNPVISKKKRRGVSAWEKALYYLSVIEKDFDNVWFFEDDVFIPNLELILNLDSRYPAADLVSSSYRVNHSGEVENWFWWKSVPMSVLPLPWAESMVCAVRVSRSLLNEIDRLIVVTAKRMAILHMLAKPLGILFKISRKIRLTSKSNSSIFKYLFIEYIFHTLALHRGFRIETPSELETIQFSTKWTLTDLDGVHIYHPIKNIGQHNSYRLSIGIGSTGRV